MTTLTPSSEIRVATRQAGGFYALKSTEEDIVASRDHFTTHIVLEEKSALAGRRNISTSETTSERRQPGFTIRGEAEPPSRSTNGSNPHSNFTSEPGTVAWTTTAPKFSAPVRLPASRSLQPPKTQTQRLSSLDPRRPLNSRIPSSLLNRALNGSGTVISSRKEHGWSRSVSAVAPEFPDALGRAATRLSSPKSSATQKPRFGAHDSARGSPLFLRHHNPAQRRQILPD